MQIKANFSDDRKHIICGSESGGKQIYVDICVHVFIMHTIDIQMRILSYTYKFCKYPYMINSLISIHKGIVIWDTEPPLSESLLHPFSSLFGEQNDRNCSCEVIANHSKEIEVCLYIQMYAYIHIYLNYI
jgi:hypothetical protein